jgi:hypothetical protein
MLVERLDAASAAFRVGYEMAPPIETRSVFHAESSANTRQGFC